MLVPHQTDRAELLDLGSGTLCQVRESLHDIRRINAFLGGARVAVNAIFAILQERELKRATVLDIGTGAADIPLRLRRQAARREIDLKIIALDLNARHLQIAREDIAKTAGAARDISLLRADAFALPLADKSVDIVIASLFTHHFRAPDIVRLLNEFSRVARTGWVINDLVRHNIPLYFFRLVRPIFARSHLTRHDAQASIRRGYTTEEMQKILERNELHNVQLRAHFPYRMSLAWQRNEDE